MSHISAGAINESVVRRWKSYPAYKDSGVEWLGEIPAHWEVWKISHAYKRIGSGTTPATNDLSFYDGDIPWVNTSELRENVITDTTAKLTECALKEHSVLSLYPPATLLVAMYGATIGRLGILGVTACTNQACCALADPVTLDTKFTFYWLGMRRQEIIVLSSGGGQPNINQEKIRAIRIPAPSLFEQQAIASFLNRETAKIDTLITKKEQLIQLLQEKRTALISHAVTKGLNPDVPMKDSGVEWLGEIPAHWEVKRLKFLTSFVTSGSRGWAQYYRDNGAIFLRIGNLSRTSIDLDFQDIQYVSPPQGAEGERTRVQQNDVLVSVTAYVGSIGLVAEDIGEAYVNQHIALTRPRQEAINSRWLAHSFLSQVGQAQFGLLLYGGTKDGLGLDDVKNLLTLVPPLAEQHTIVAFIDREFAKIDALIAKIRTGIEQLKEYRTALISSAVTGKIDIRAEA